MSTIIVNHGDTIDLAITYTDASGSLLDLSSATVSVVDSQPPEFAEAAQVTVNSELDSVRLYVAAADAMAALGRGRVNKFRLKAVFGPTSEDVTPEIWIEVR